METEVETTSLTTVFNTELGPGAVNMSLNTSLNLSLPSKSFDKVSNISGVDIVTIIIQFVLSVFIVGGNVLSILAVRRTHRLHTVANKYVVSLAVADLMAGLVLPFYAVKLIPGVDAVFNRNRYLCLSCFVVLIISAGNSMVTMVQIAVDRLIYIAYPLRYRRIATHFRAKIIIASSWIFAIIIGTIPLYYNRWEQATSCDTFQVLTMEYQVYIQFLVFCLCCVVSGVCYTVIFKISYHQRKALGDLNSGRKASTDTTDIKTTFRREWPMIKMFVLVFGVFLVCWTPPMVGIVIGSTVGVGTSTMNILVALCLLNSGMNFIIYGVKNRDFRRAYIRLLCGDKWNHHDQLNMVPRSGSPVRSASGDGSLLT